MKPSKLEEKFNSFVNSGTMPEIEDIMVFQTSDGEYELYNKYYISRTPDKSYVVTMKDTHAHHTFYKLKNAVVWCTYDKRNKISDADKIIDLDLKLHGADSNAEVYTGLFKKTKNVDSKLLYAAKLTEEKVKKTYILAQLDLLVTEAKNWQLKRFIAKPAH